MSHRKTFSRRAPKRTKCSAQAIPDAPCPVHHDLDLADVLVYQFDSIQQGCAADDGRAVLVIVEDGYPHRLDQSLLDVEALRGLDILQVNAAEGGFEQLADLDDVVRIVTIDFQVEHIDVSKALEKHGLSFHDGLSSKSSDVSQSQHRSAVGDDGDQIAARGVLESVERVLRNLQARFRHTRCIR